MKIILRKMGMDLYGGDEKWNMGSYRVRPMSNEMGNLEHNIVDKDGHKIGGDFQFFRGNKYHPDALGWDFTDYGVDGEDSKAYRGLDDYFWHTLEPTLENIKMLLEHITGKDIELEWEKA